MIAWRAFNLIVSLANVINTRSINAAHKTAIELFQLFSRLFLDFSWNKVEPGSLAIRTLTIYRKLAHHRVGEEKNRVSVSHLP